MRGQEIHGVRREALNTVLSRREYRMDALATVALWARTSSMPYTLQEIQAALERPGYVLYLGRKSCPLALPVEPQLVSSESVTAVLAGVRFADRDTLRPLPMSDSPMLYWEDDAEAEDQSKNESTSYGKEEESVRVVFVVKDGVAKQIEVKTGISSDTEWEILEGVEEGDEVVSGSYRVLSKQLKDGNEVKVDNSLKKYGREDE